MPDFVYPPAPVLVETTGNFAVGATGVLRATEGGDPVQVWDLNDSPLASVVVGPKGAHQAFKADIAHGVLDFGSVLLPAISNEAQAAALAVQEAAEEAAASAASAAASAEASRDVTDDGVAGFVASAQSATGVALRAASGTYTGDRVWTGTHDFTVAPTVAGEPIGTGGSGGTSHPLPRWAAELAASPSTAKIAFLGDSTSAAGFQEIPQIKTQLTDVHTVTGGDLAGVQAANIQLYGIAGHTTNGYWAEASVGGPVTTFAPDLIVYSMGINDVRFGATTATLVSRIVTEIDLIRAALPNADLVLRVPNSITTDGGDGSISAAQAQTFTDILRNAYLQLVGRWTNTRVLNTQDRIFGRISRSFATGGLMFDQIHPSGRGVRAVADALAEELIGLRASFLGWVAIEATPAAPAALTITATPGDGQVTVTASGGTGATSFALYRSTTVTGSPIATAFPFTDTGRTNGTTVSYIATATNSGGTVTSNVATATPAAAGPTAIVSDNFTRADDASSLGTATTGQTYTYKGTWGIVSNTARYLAVGSATGSFRHATVDAGVADCTVQATVAVSAGEQGICFRMTDAENYLLLRMGGNGNSNYELFRIEAGAGNQLASVVATSPGLPATLKVVLSGSTITPYVNGVAQAAITSTFNQTATRHGLWAAGNGTGNAYDDFTVTA